MVDSDKQKLHLKIQIGSSYTDLKDAYVNDPSKATHIDNEYFIGDVVVRVKNYRGTNPDGSSAKALDDPYFGATSDTSSVQFEGTIRAQVSGDDVLFGNDFDEPIRDCLPPGTSLGLKALKWIDPGLETDLYGERPWALSPLLATMNLLDTTGAHQHHSTTKGAGEEGGGGIMGRVVEDTSNLVGEKVTTKQRRAYFADKAHREKYQLGGLTVAGDFSNPFIDFNSLSVALPYVNLHISILQYWKGQPFRYTCKTREGGVLFCVVFQLVDELGNKVVGEEVAENQGNW